MSTHTSFESRKGELSSFQRFILAHTTHDGSGKAGSKLKFKVNLHGTGVELMARAYQQLKEIGLHQKIGDVQLIKNSRRNKLRTQGILYNAKTGEHIAVKFKPGEGKFPKDFLHSNAAANR